MPLANIRTRYLTPCVAGVLVTLPAAGVRRPRGEPALGLRVFT